MKALRYHARRPTGKTQITATKPCDTATDLALAYTPGVATPCRAIQRHPDSVYRYTNKGNLVAIVSNGTAVLGLGNLGPLAAKPVMEGKSFLFNDWRTSTRLIWNSTLYILKTSCALSLQ
jgi:malate dehydrogenase (oxaloacetate-decarboxylating)(NADP+)